MINSFNSKNDKCIIEKHRYESSDKLFLDIMSGKELDILYVGDWINMVSMCDKNLFCNLYDFIDSDNDISRSMYVEPVLNSLEINGKLYQMPHDFIVQSAIAKKEFWANDMDNSVNSVLEKSRRLGYKAPFDFSINSYSFISVISSEFIDFENSSCCFDDCRFEDILIMMKEYNDFYGNISKNYPNGAIDLLKNDEIMMMSSEFAGFIQLDYLTYLIGDKIKYVGLPSDIPNYHIAVPIVSFSVFDNSKNKQGAFEFIKDYTSYNSYIYDTPTIDGTVQKQTCIPINNAALSCLASNSLKEDSPFGLDEKTRKENCDDILNQIYSVNGTNNPAGYTVKNILIEEIPYYVDGSKTASEVCSMIQNILSTYFNEQK
ncbi:MAG: hypothetical protein NC078_03005 [Ruminococcus sp.]|nr:hypothetical protein [Ruminococcus sp.]